MDNNDDDDDASAEGRAARNLFRTDSEDSSDENDVVAPRASATEATTITVTTISTSTATTRSTPTATTTTDQTTTVVRRVLHIEVEEMTLGGSIEHRLWPAAEYLANFVLQLAHPQQGTALIDQRSFPHDENHHTNNSGRRVDGILAILHRMLSSSSSSLHILELGAGLGLTGLALASQLPHTRVLLTDLESALPLLRANVHRNHQHNTVSTDSKLVVLSSSNRDDDDDDDNNNRNPTNLPRDDCNTPDCCDTQPRVQVQRLEWGNASDVEAALEWHQHHLIPRRSDNGACSIVHPCAPPPPLLILGSDCVYWETLHQPLAQTLVALLQPQQPATGSNSHSIALLAGMRRWKRDNYFYQRSLEKLSATSAGCLQCTCLDEQVTRAATHSDTNAETERTVMRIYAVQWIEK